MQGRYEEMIVTIKWDISDPWVKRLTSQRGVGTFPEILFRTL